MAYNGRDQKYLAIDSNVLDAYRKHGEKAHESWDELPLMP